MVLGLSHRTGSCLQWRHLLLTGTLHAVAAMTSRLSERSGIPLAGSQQVSNDATETQASHLNNKRVHSMCCPVGAIVELDLSVASADPHACHVQKRPLDAQQHKWSPRYPADRPCRHPVSSLLFGRAHLQCYDYSGPRRDVHQSNSVLTSHKAQRTRPLVTSAGSRLSCSH